MNCQHNAYLESIKTSIIGKKLGKCQKHNRQILEHNRLRPNAYAYRCDRAKKSLFYKLT